MDLAYGAARGGQINLLASLLKPETYPNTIVALNLPPAEPVGQPLNPHQPHSALSSSASKPRRCAPPMNAREITNYSHIGSGALVGGHPEVIDWLLSNQFISLK